MSLITLTPSKLPLTAAPLAFYSSASSTIGFDNSIPYSDSTLDIPYSRYNLISSSGSVYNEMKGLSSGDAMLLGQLLKRITTLGFSWNWILVGAHWLWSRLRFLAGRKCKTGSGRRFSALDQSKARWVFFMLQYARRRAGWWLG